MKTLLLLLALTLPLSAQSIKRNSATTNAVPVATYVGGVLTNAANVTGGTTNNSTGFYGNATGLTNIPAAQLTAGSVVASVNGYSITNINRANEVAGTNVCIVRPDFALPFQYFSTNAAFVFLAAINVDAGKTQAQTCVVLVTNTTAAAVAITATAPINLTGTAFVTNLTEIRFLTYGQKFTNAIATPIF